MPFHPDLALIVVTCVRFLASPIGSGGDVRMSSVIFLRESRAHVSTGPKKQISRTSMQDFEPSSSISEGLAPRPLLLSLLFDDDSLGR
jgi:hypothetical protein